MQPLKDPLAEFAEHVHAVEGSEGTHQAILATAPRLAHAVAKLDAEHRRLTAELEELTARTARLAAELARHHQREIDLLHEAYATDIGGTD